MKSLTLLSVITLIAFTIFNCEEPSSSLYDKGKSKPSALHLEPPTCEHYNPTGDPVGGGSGYSDIISPTSTVYKVNNKTSFLTAIGSATSPDTIYIVSGTNIELTESDVPIVLNSGVTLASCRGDSTAARIYIDDKFTLNKGNDKSGAIYLDDNCRLTGIQLKGPITERGDGSDSAMVGVYINRAEGVDVDNCEIWGWSHAAIRVRGTHTKYFKDCRANIHHNYIYYNRMKKKGYGITVANSAFATIHANKFNHNKHDIAGNGHGLSSYEAKYNIIIATDVDHSFDMHRCKLDTHKQDDICFPDPAGGDSIIIESNTWYSVTQEAVKIHGEPHSGAWIKWNNIGAEFDEDLIMQDEVENPPQNFNEGNNDYECY